jgi:ABC-type nitrate/sulfonate/bicarbonate transport system substrate-binding protein
MQRLGFFLTCFFVFILTSLGFYSCTPPEATVTIGIEKTPVNSLVYIALSNRYFRDNGIRLIVKNNYASGAAAVRGMLKGEADLATATEYVVVRQVFAGNKLQILASIDKFMHQYLVWRKDRGIKDVGDLENKKIGVPLETQARFNLSRYLVLHHVDEKKLHIVDVQAPEAVAALSGGGVDAVVVWQPNVMALVEHFGDKIEVRSIHNDQPAFCLVTAGEEWIRLHPGLAAHLITALSRAEEFVVNNNTQAKNMIKTRLNYNDAYINMIWPDHELTLSLDQSLVVAMEDQARWMIENRLTPINEVPNFMDYIHEHELKKIKPQSVNIIR